MATARRSVRAACGVARASHPASTPPQPLAGPDAPAATSAASSAPHSPPTWVPALAPSPARASKAASSSWIAPRILRSRAGRSPLGASACRVRYEDRKVRRGAQESDHRKGGLHPPTTPCPTPCIPSLPVRMTHLPRPRRPAAALRVCTTPPAARWHAVQLPRAPAPPVAPPSQPPRGRRGCWDTRIRTSAGGVRWSDAHRY
mmetsp:Transcript_54300/g.172444  ORF Transcript_54300/g.172444 Transcript_54300/m.172444 type:complete len:202 (-) Transcript_54300:65-670(-)